MIKTINRFDAAVNMVPKEGISILHVDVEDAPFYIQYDTKEELEQDFNIDIHPFYKSINIEPKTIVKDWGEGSVDISVKGGTQEVYLNTNCLYMVKDGKVATIGVENER